MSIECINISCLPQYGWNQILFVFNINFMIFFFFLSFIFINELSYYSSLKSDLNNTDKAVIYTLINHSNRKFLFHMLFNLRQIYLMQNVDFVWDKDFINTVINNRLSEFIKMFKKIIQKKNHNNLLNILG